VAHKYDSRGVHVRCDGMEIATTRGTIPLTREVEAAMKDAVSIAQALDHQQRCLYLNPVKIVQQNSVMPVSQRTGDLDPALWVMLFNSEVAQDVSREMYVAFMQSWQGNAMCLPSSYTAEDGGKIYTLLVRIDSNFELLLPAEGHYPKAQPRPVLFLRRA